MKKRLLFFIVVTLLFAFEITFTSAQELLQENVIGFTGQDYFESVDLVLFPARAYSPNTGRFLQRDPSGYVDGENLYEYVSGNPLGSVDSLGLQSKEIASLARRLSKIVDKPVDELSPIIRNNAKTTATEGILVRGSGSLGKSEDTIPEGNRIVKTDTLYIGSGFIVERTDRSSARNKFATISGFGNSVRKKILGFLDKIGLKRVDKIREIGKPSQSKPNLVVRRYEEFENLEIAKARAKQAVTEGIETAYSEQVRKAGRVADYRDQIGRTSLEKLPMGEGRPILEFTRIRRAPKRILPGTGDLWDDMAFGSSKYRILYKKEWVGGRGSTDPTKGIDAATFGRGVGFEGGVGFYGKSGSKGVQVDTAIVRTPEGSIIFRREK